MHAWLVEIRWMSYRTTERIKWVYGRTDYSGICCVYLLFLFRLCFVYHTFSSWVFVHSLSACISCLRRPDCLNKVQYSIGRRTSTWVVLPPNRLYIDSSCYVGNQSVIGSQRERDIWIFGGFPKYNSCSCAVFGGLTLEFLASTFRSRQPFSFI